MDYERGLEQLKQYLRGTAWEQEFRVYEARLRENLEDERKFGSSGQKKAERVQIIDQLNHLAQRVNVSFNDLCLRGNTSHSLSASKPNYVTGNYTQLNVPPAFTGNFPGSVAAKPNFPGMHNSNNTAYNPVKPATTSNSFWLRYRWKIIAIISVPLAVFFALTTLYLLITRPLPASNGTPEAQTTATVHSSTNIPATHNLTATPSPHIGATTVDSTTQPTTTLSSTTTNYQFTCPDCLDNIGVVLQDIKINTSTQTMTWDFNITYNNNKPYSVKGALSLQTSTGDTLQAKGGTFTQFISMAPGQTLPRSAIFSSIPNRDVQYTVTLTMYSSTANTYQSVLFSY
jgi:hypothetical protein